MFEATFLKVSIDDFDVSWNTVPAVVRLSLSDGLRLAYNNISETRHRKVTSLGIPTLDVQVLLTPGTTKQWLEVGRIRTGVQFELYSAPKGWRSDAEMQKLFLRMQDAETKRFASTVEAGPRKRKNILEHFCRSFLIAVRDRYTKMVK